MGLEILNRVIHKHLDSNPLKTFTFNQDPFSLFFNSLVTHLHYPIFRVIDVPVQSQCYDVAWNPKYYLLAYATAAGERDRDTVRLFGCPGESRRT